MYSVHVIILGDELKKITKEMCNKKPWFSTAFYISSLSIYCITSSTLHFKILQNISIVCVLTLSSRFNLVIYPGLILYFFIRAYCETLLC